MNFYYKTSTKNTNDYINVSKQVRMDFLLQHRFGTESNINLLSKDMIKYLLKIISDGLFSHYRMLICNIGVNEFLIDSSLKDMIPETSKYRNADLKITDLINEKTLPKIKDKSDEELAETVSKLIEFFEHYLGNQDYMNHRLNESSNTRILNEWEKKFISSLNNDVNLNLTIISSHICLSPLVELCTRRMIDLYTNIIHPKKMI